MENLTALSYDLRKDVIDMICAGKAGHIGGDMSVMDTLVALYFNQMNVTPDNMDDPNHDRFVMSKGHSVEALYAVLAKKGFFPIQEVIDTFSKFGSQFIGHPNNKASGNRNELRFSGTWTSGKCWYGTCRKNEWSHLSCIHRYG